jgi:hypothetical protein
MSVRLGIAARDLEAQKKGALLRVPRGSRLEVGPARGRCLDYSGRAGKGRRRFPRWADWAQ